jgi:hypothetical protein
MVVIIDTGSGQSVASPAKAGRKTGEVSRRGKSHAANGIAFIETIHARKKPGVAKLSVYVQPHCRCETHYPIWIIRLSVLTARTTKPSPNGLVWRKKATFFT